MVLEGLDILTRPIFLVLMIGGALFAMGMMSMGIRCQFDESFRKRPWVKRLMDIGIMMSMLTMFGEDNVEQNVISLWTATGFVMTLAVALGLFLEVRTW